MKSRLRYLLWSAEVTLLLLGVWFEPTCCVRGTLRGEAFHDGKPTSWWRAELIRWEDHIEISDPPNRHIRIHCNGRRAHRGLGWLAKIGFTRFAELSAEEQDRQFISFAIAMQRPPMDTIFRELIDDPSPRIRELARAWLDLPPEGGQP